MKVKYRKACRTLGGKKRLEALADRVSKKRGVSVWIGAQVNEEEPDDNWLNAIFMYPPERFDDFLCAVNDVDRDFRDRGLALQFECNGDADGILMSYRTVEAY